MDLTPAALARHHALDDVFALRRISDEQLVNLVGVGRGEGWAGNISVDPDREPLVARALREHAVVRHDGGSTRIFGPYWNTSAAVAVVGDFVVVLGGAGVRDLDDARLLELAGDLAWSAGEVSAEKRLADELEVTKAALSIASLPHGDRATFLRDLASIAADSLSCEFGAVLVQHPRREVVLARGGWRPDVEESAIVDELEALVEAIAAHESGAPHVVQDLSDSGVDGVLGFSSGLVSRCVVPLESASFRGALIVAHAQPSPRGFTQLCQQVAVTIGQQAVVRLAAPVANAA